MECIVLAGGLGTRLQGVIGATPKCMAMVAGQPFLYHILQYLTTQKCTRVILSLGYKHEQVSNWLIATDWDFEITTVVEYEPLGTGGGIVLAMAAAKEEQVFVLNGDTMFAVDLQKMMQFHQSHKSATTLALKPLQNFDRYGVVRCDTVGKIIAFEEKKQQESGTINGGIYILEKAFLISKKMPEKFSFEKDYLEAFVSAHQFWGFECNQYFIDIGVPCDYEQAQKDFEQ